MNQQYYLKYYLVTLCLILQYFAVYGQSVTDAAIDNIDFELINNKLIINYDIKSLENNEKFYVWIEVYNTHDVQIIPNTLTGDVNRVIHSGSNKSIIWNLYKDMPEFNDEIYIRIYAIKYTSVQKLLLLSAACPGLGNYMIDRDNYNWAISGAAFSALFTSLIIEEIAQNNYKNYKNAITPESRDNYMNKALQLRKISNTLLIASSAIWIGSLSYTFLEKLNYDKNLKLLKYNKDIQGTMKYKVSLDFYSSPNISCIPVLSTKLFF